MGTVMSTEPAYVTVEAELRVPVATVQILHFHVPAPLDRVVHQERDLRLDLSLTARTPNARMAFSGGATPLRFEKVGKVFMLPPRHELRARTDAGRQASIVCQLMLDKLRDWFEFGPEWTDRQLAASLDVGSPTIKSLLMRLGEEARHPGFASAVLAEAIAVQIAVEISRYYAGIADQPKTGGLAPWRLRLIDERLKELRKPPTLAELAELCHLSARQLTRGFRASRGCSIADHVAQCRIENAKRYLMTGESIKSIAYSVGFASPSSFCQAFRMATGETPHRFRENAARAGR
jgi:AraC family transcriptional regulator